MTPLDPWAAAARPSIRGLTPAAVTRATSAKPASNRFVFAIISLLKAANSD
jgi:hypothetical protein